MADEPDNTREHGIEFGELAGDLEAESYPLSHETLLDRYGDRELELVDGEVTVREVLSADTEREYEDMEGVQQAILNMVGDEAVGRENYTDRGGNVEDDDDEDSAEAQSF
ncbi:DUF5789 family protein [Halorubrum halophilum]|uniref:DUF5789 family protein n=1 Tax=Halorubrum halophilum TaxID=413816 RepID=UPI000679CD13|nr:hypothetical protein [Halorubrum halophilum]